MFTESKIRNVILVTCFCVTIQLKSAPEVEWEHVYPNPTAKWLSAAAWGPPGFVAVGRDEFLFSPDGAQWKRLTLSGVVNPWLNAVCYHDGKYVAVGNGDLIMLSTNGENWNIINASTNGALFNCTGGAGTFAAVGSQARMLVSSNGVHWQERLTPATFVDIAFGNGIWVALTGGSTVYTSSNLVDWTSIQTEPGVTAIAGGPASKSVGSISFGSLLTRIAYGNGRFVAGGAHGPDSPFGGFATLFRISTNGLNWQPITGLNSLGEVRDVVFAGEQFAAVTRWNLLRSADGMSWQSIAAPDAGGDLNALAGSDDGHFVAVGAKGSVLRSDDGATWQVISKDTRVEIHAIAWAKGRFVAAGGSPHYIGGPLGTAAILTSTNGRDWQARLTNLIDQLSGVAYGNGVWVVTGDDGQIFVSRNGTDWIDRSLPPTSHDLWQVVYGRGRFVAFAAFRDLVYRSAKGKNWAPVEAPLVSEMWKAKFLNRRFVGVGGDDDGYIFLSRNGVKWNKKTLPGTGWFSGVAYGAGRYVVAGRDTSAVSFNGVEWTVHPTPRIVDDLQYIDGWFVGVGPNGMLFSRDGVEWQVPTEQETPANLSFLSSGAGALISSDGVMLYRGTLQEAAAFAPTSN